MKQELQGRTALVTGASSGLGVDFAHELASRGAGLILVARREDRLAECATELRKRLGVNVTVITADIAGAEGAEALKQRVDAEGLEVDILVNNAGFGQFGHFLDIDPAAEASMLDLDIQSLTRMTRLFVEPMVARGRGRILQVASLGAYQPYPTYAAYGAAKAYVLNYSHAVNCELKGSGVTCTTVSPGVTRTEFLDVAGQEPSLYQRLVMMESAAVARAGVRAMLRGRPEVVPGVANKLSAFATRLLPRSWSGAVAGYLMT